ncbi:ORF1 [Diaporthe ambigua RNA virus 1]|uniref:ORF1 n=1 Tax=Diaporthe ambigua RNA virus 1 TaxID=111470 RepID=UPI00000F891A|nr:ORF1 [Diaporthe ambigua RNA virus 1]AAF22957.1 ORF1 [Diaporthe ambigua RNA virus 1]
MRFFNELMMTTDIATYYSFASWYGRTFGYGVPFWFIWRDFTLYVGFDVPEELVAYALSLFSIAWLTTLIYFHLWATAFVAVAWFLGVVMLVRAILRFVEWFTFGLAPFVGGFVSSSTWVVSCLCRALMYLFFYLPPPLVAGQLLKLTLSLLWSLVWESIWLPVDLWHLGVGSWRLGSVGWDGSNRVVQLGGFCFRIRFSDFVYPYRVLVLPGFVLGVLHVLPGGFWLCFPSFKFEQLGVLGSLFIYPLVETKLIFVLGWVDVAFVLPWLAAVLVGVSFSYREVPFSRADLQGYLGLSEPSQDASVLSELDALLKAKSFADAEGVALVAAVGARGGVPRLRARGKLACRLQALLGGRKGCVGAFFSGRWVPDLPASDRSPALNAILAVQREQVKVLGVGTFPTKSGVGGDYVLVESRSGDRRVILPSLLSRLCLYSSLRERDEKLLVGLRSRAVEWCRLEQVPDWVPLLCLSSSVADAAEISGPEVEARRRLRSSLGIDTLASF